MRKEATSNRAYERSLHDKIIYDILPRFAEKLKQEEMISSYDREPFKIQLKKEIMPDLPPLEIKPDCILYLPNGNRFLVEVVNPKDPKRFMGEIKFIHLLSEHKLIESAFLYVLPYKKKYKGVHAKRTSQAGMITLDHKGNMKFQVLVSWAGDEDIDYFNLKSMVREALRL